jgi:hypothetical protein
MKKEFTRAELLSLNSNEAIKILELLPQSKQSFTVVDILEAHIIFESKWWLISNHCELSLDETKELAYKLVEMACIIYKNKYPNDFRVVACLKGIDKFKKGEINTTCLIVKRGRAYGAYENDIHNSIVDADFDYPNKDEENNDAKYAYSYAAEIAKAAWKVSADYVGGHVFSFDSTKDNLHPDCCDYDIRTLEPNKSAINSIYIAFLKLHKLMLFPKRDVKIFNSLPFYNQMLKQILIDFFK